MHACHTPEQNDRRLMPSVNPPLCISSIGLCSSVTALPRESLFLEQCDLACQRAHALNSASATRQGDHASDLVWLLAIGRSYTRETGNTTR